MNFLFYGLIGGIFVVVKLALRSAETSDLLFLLRPLDWLVGLLTGVSGVYVVGQGFVHEGLGAVIDKSCAGANFALICFVMLAWLGVRELKSGLGKAASLGVALVVGYLTAIVTSAARIYVTLTVHRLTVNLVPASWERPLHLAMGTAVYLFFLIAIYWLALWCLNRRIKDEKPA